LVELFFLVFLECVANDGKVTSNELKYLDDCTALRTRRLHMPDAMRTSDNRADSPPESITSNFGKGGGV
jgi:hypothetical protein